ncbi:MAG TPA: hypothetical protein VGW77_08190 [Candidatus Binatia bacterium]|nr:hypothetical protein [Candidatus Binatia bacterium]
MDKLDRQNLLEAAIITAQQLGLGMEVVQLEPQLGAARPDALVRVRYGDQEVKREIRPAMLGAVTHGCVSLNRAGGG